MSKESNKNLDAKYWDLRYHEQRMGWDLGKVSRPIKAYIDSLDNKDLRILIPGAGNAYEAEYLFKQGFKHVFVVDVSVIALNNFKNRVPEFPVKQLLNCDFFDVNGQFDLILEQTFFCALLPKFRMAYAIKMHNLLTENGILTGVLFIFPLTNSGPPFGGSTEEFANYFEPLFRVLTLAPCKNSEPQRQGKEAFFKLIKS